MKFVVPLALLLLSACSHFEFSSESVLNARENQVQMQLEQSELKLNEDLLAKGSYQAAHDAFLQFQQTYPQSYYVMSAKLGQAQALEGLGQWAEAARLEREVSLATLKEQPEIAALALYRLSFSYLEIGEDAKAAAALLDAQRLGRFLPPQVRYAEIPARLAAFYAQQGRDKESGEYLNDAEKGIQKVMADPQEELRSDWLAKTYYQMGIISTNQLSEANFSEFILGERAVQVYLLKCLKLQEAQWSAKSLQYLNDMYRNLDQIIEAQKNRSKQIQMGGEFFDLIEGADLFRPQQGQKESSFEKSFYAMLTQMRRKTEAMLYTTAGGMVLTEESQRLNSLKRVGRVKPDTLLPQEQKNNIPLPPKIVPSEDPNL